MSQILENIHEKPLKEKLHLMAETIRNNQGIEQCLYGLWNGENRFCVMGLLGFRAGIPKEELPVNSDSNIYKRIFDKYGISYKESLEIYIKNPLLNNSTKLRTVYALNDSGCSFNTIADMIDKTAESLK